MFSRGEALPIRSPLPQPGLFTLCHGCHEAPREMFSHVSHTKVFISSEPDFTFHNHGQLI